MAAPEGPLDFTTACRYAGQLFLESRHEIERLHRQAADLRARLERAEAERDDALRLLAARGRPEAA